MPPTATNETAHSLDQDLEAVKRDLTSLRTDIKGLTDTLLTQSKQSAKAAGEQIQKGVTDSTEAVRSNIAQHPLTSIAVAGAVGLLLGVILHRR